MRNQAPSHRNSTNERNERRAAWKAVQKIGAKSVLPADAMLAKFEKQAAAFVATGAVEAEGNRYRVRIGNRTRFYPVYRIAGAFKCDCNDFYEHKTCPHALAAEKFAAREEAARREAEKPYRAELRHGNRKGLDFAARESFSEKQAAIEWLVREAFNKFMPEGEVTDRFGETVFQISEEFFEMWDEAA